MDKWRSHPRFREIIEYAERNKETPSEVLRQAELQLPGYVYRTAVSEAKNLREKLAYEESRSSSLREAKAKYGSLEELTEAIKKYHDLGIEGVIFAVVLIITVTFVFQALRVDSNLCCGIVVLFVILGYASLRHFFGMAHDLAGARDAWREELLEEATRKQLSREKNRIEVRQHLYSLSPRGFEQEVVKILRRNGYDAEITDYVADHGVDAIVRKDSKTYVVQIKQYAEDNLVGTPELRNLQGAMLYKKVDGMIFVTLGYFSKPAEEYGKKQGIMLIDGLDLLKMAVSQGQ